jgi:hypothetical protein
MPLSHRIACLRDDVVFFVYLYQRYLSPPRLAPRRPAPRPTPRSAPGAPRPRCCAAARTRASARGEPRRVTHGGAACGRSYPVDRSRPNEFGLVYDERENTHEDGVPRDAVRLPAPASPPSGALAGALEGSARTRGSPEQTSPAVAQERVRRRVARLSLDGAHAS